MNSDKLQQLKDEITQKMIDGLQTQDFEKLLEKYDVLSQAKLKFVFTLNLDADESIDVKNIGDPEVAAQACGICVPCWINRNLTMCPCC